VPFSLSPIHRKDLVSTRLAPTCDRCGAQANGQGFALDPKTLKALCLSCAIRDESERERVLTDAIRELMRQCEKALGRRPVSIPELVKWAEDQEGTT
jgi:hypothetical protein